MAKLNLIDASGRELLRRLELTINHRLDGYLQGAHPGLIPGHGTELGETRTYQPGDDVRRIDWNVSARLAGTHVRQTIAERELQTWLVVDRSARLNFGTHTCEKRVVALTAAAAFGFATQRDANQLGALLTGGGTAQTIPPRSSKRHLFKVLDAIATTDRNDFSGVTDLAKCLRRCASIARRRGLVALISDFRVKPGWEKPLGALRRRHDVITVQISDPREFKLPNVGRLPVIDPATGATHELPTHRRSFRNAYAQKAQLRQQNLETTLRKLGTDHVHLSTDGDWLQDISRFVAARKMRRHPALTRTVRQETC